MVDENLKLYSYVCFAVSMWLLTVIECFACVIFFTWILSSCVFAFGSSFLSGCKFSTEGKRCDLHTAQEQECGVHFAACACSLVQCSPCVVFHCTVCSVPGEKVFRCTLFHAKQCV